MKKIQVTSSGFYCSLNEASIISTFLGVYVCIWYKRLNRGGMCHFRLPRALYIAPSERQFKLNQLENENIIIEIIDFPPMNVFAPSVYFIFNSALKIKNKLLICSLLSGMGNDGDQCLKKQKERGAITLIQDEKSSVVFGMVREAKKIGAECQTLPLSRISACLHEILKLHLYKMQLNSVEYRKNDDHMEISKERI